MLKIKTAIFAAKNIKATQLSCITNLFTVTDYVKCLKRSKNLEQHTSSDQLHTI